MASVAGGNRTSASAKFWSRQTSVLGSIVLIGLCVLSFAAPWIVPNGPEVMNPADSLLPPSLAYPLGTDIYGRDQLARILYGGRISLGLGIVSVSLSLAIGLPLGLIAGYWRGWPNILISQCTDILMAFPSFLLALAIVSVLGASLQNVVISVGIASSPMFIRLVRGSVMQVRELPYVEAARSVGCSDFRMLVRHIIPNILSPVIIISALGLGSAILAAASLSFLGLGVQPPTAEWGVMLDESRSSLRVAWWLTFMPGAALMLAVISINLIGDGLRDALDTNDS